MTTSSPYSFELVLSSLSSPWLAQTENATFLHSFVQRPICTTRTYGPYVRAVKMARTYGWRKMHPDLRPICMGLTYRCIFRHARAGVKNAPVRTGHKDGRWYRLYVHWCVSALTPVPTGKKLSQDLCSICFLHRLSVTFVILLGMENAATMFHKHSSSMLYDTFSKSRKFITSEWWYSNAFPNDLLETNIWLVYDRLQQNPTCTSHNNLSTAFFHQPPDHSTVIFFGTRSTQLHASCHNLLEYFCVPQWKDVTLWAMLPLIFNHHLPCHSVSVNQSKAINRYPYSVLR